MKYLTLPLAALFFTALSYLYISEQTPFDIALGIFSLILAGVCVVLLFTKKSKYK